MGPIIAATHHKSDHVWSEEQEKKLKMYRARLVDPARRVELFEGEPDVSSPCTKDDCPCADFLRPITIVD